MAGLMYHHITTTGSNHDAAQTCTLHKTISISSITFAVLSTLPVLSG